MSDTEAQVREILHMDYDTFTNTAFLLQGRADMFTRSSPTKRKEVLAEVLDLSYYRGLEERAKEQSRVREESIRDAETATAMRQDDLARKPELEGKLTSVKATLDRVEPQVDAQRLKMEEARGAAEALRGHRVETRRADSPPGRRPARDRRPGAAGGEPREQGQRLRGNAETGSRRSGSSTPGWMRPGPSWNA